MKYSCLTCEKSFDSVRDLQGHKRMHGISSGKINQVFCSSLLTKSVVCVKNLDKHNQSYLKALKYCQNCGDQFKSTFGARFCTKSCSASFTNKLYPKRIKAVRPPKPKKEKIPLSEKEAKARRVQHVLAYRAKKYGATPKDVDRKLLNKIYLFCPQGYEVDHIIALAEGGPHSPDNLQYLPALENRKKNKTQNYDRSKIIRWQDVFKDT